MSCPCCGFEGGKLSQCGFHEGKTKGHACRKHTNKYLVMKKGQFRVHGYYTHNVKGTPYANGYRKRYGSCRNSKLTREPVLVKKAPKPSSRSSTSKKWPPKAEYWETLVVNYWNCYNPGNHSSREGKDSLNADLAKYRDHFLNAKLRTITDSIQIFMKQKYGAKSLEGIASVFGRQSGAVTLSAWWKTHNAGNKTPKTDILIEWMDTKAKSANANATEAKSTSSTTALLNCRISVKKGEAQLCSAGRYETLATWNSVFNGLKTVEKNKDSLPSVTTYDSIPKTSAKIPTLNLPIQDKYDSITLNKTIKKKILNYILSFQTTTRVDPQTDTPLFPNTITHIVKNKLEQYSLTDYTGIIETNTMHKEAQEFIRDTIKEKKNQPLLKAVMMEASTGDCKWSTGSKAQANVMLAINASGSDAIVEMIDDWVDHKIKQKGKSKVTHTIRFKSSSNKSGGCTVARTCWSVWAMIVK